MNHIVIKCSTLSALLPTRIRISMNVFLFNRPGDFSGPVIMGGGPPGVVGMGGLPFRRSPGPDESDFSRLVFMLQR